MESPAVSPASRSSYQMYRAKLSINAVVIEKSFGGGKSEDTTGAGINNLFKGLSITADEIIEKLNELLKTALPNGVQSLKPEEVTPEATATKIVNGVTAFFDNFAERNPELEGEELINAFMKEVRSGVQQGYDDAFQTLEGLGAFGFEGVKEGVQQTKVLIEEKLAAFEKAKRQEMGLDSGDVASEVKADVSSQLLSQAGKRITVVA